jgi:hypothetical protein
MSVAAPIRPLSPLHDIIWERFSRALDIKRRLHVIRAFVNELDGTSRGEPFRIRNDIVWNAMLDVRDKLVIDLYSLTVEMRHGMKPIDPEARKSFRGGAKWKRGLFIEIRDHHLASLTRTYVPDPDDEEYECALGMDIEAKAKAFERLFPNCTADSPSATDIEDLCERFRVRMVSLGKDRNKNRAHAHEGDAGTAQMASVPEMETLFEYVEDLLNDLSMVSALALLGSTNMNHADCDETSADLVDLTLFGNISDVRRLMAKRTRDELYARLHEMHDANASPEVSDRREMRFNDWQFGPSFED